MNIFAFILDPNVIYLILIAALLATVTSVQLPGTGLAEALAAAGVIGVVLLLSQTPANWFAVVLVVLGVLVFLIMPLVDRRFLMVALVGLAMQGIGGYFMFDSVRVSPVILAVMMIVSLIYYRFALLPALETQAARSQMLDDQSLVGLKGYVQTALRPVGTVYVQGETWTARRADVDRTHAEGDGLEAGSEIVVRERDGLTLFVEPVKAKRDSASDPAPETAG
ncbi:MAG: NfeD family protein [bacterium]|nr:NfeD family protein [bacterium]